MVVASGRFDQHFLAWRLKAFTWCTILRMASACVKNGTCVFADNAIVLAQKHVHATVDNINNYDTMTMLVIKCCVHIMIRMDN